MKVHAQWPNSQGKALIGRDNCGIEMRSVIQETHGESWNQAVKTRESVQKNITGKSGMEHKGSGTGKHQKLVCVVVWSQGCQRAPGRANPP